MARFRKLDGLKMQFGKPRFTVQNGSSHLRSRFKTVRFIGDSGSFQLVPAQENQVTQNRLIGPSSRCLDVTADRTGSGLSTDKADWVARWFPSIQDGLGQTTQDDQGDQRGLQIRGVAL